MADITRRQVLAGVGGIALSASGSHLLPRTLLESDRQSKPVGWAILGLGGYAQNQILPNMKACRNTKLIAVISGSPDKAKKVASQYGISEANTYSYDNLEKIKDNPEIEVVYVITPPGTHKDFTIRALESGKHVVSEKPMTGSLKDAQAMVAAAKKAKKRLGVGYRCHFEANNLEAVRICRSGQLGAIRTIRSDHGFTMTWGDGWHSNRQLGGYGAISEIGIYAIQALCYLAGADPIEVYGTRDKLNVPRFKTVEDVNHFNLIFPNGIQGFGATAYSWNANNFRVLGERGVINAEPATGSSGNVFTLNGQPITTKPTNMWADQMDHFSDCVRDTAMVLKTPGEMGVRDIAIIEAILHSADTKSPVKLSF